MDKGRFDGKVVLVTGAASGIGRATALRLVDEGARVMLADRDAAGLERTAEAASKGDAISIQVYDAADGEASAALVAQTVERFDRLDAIVCNAGIYRRDHFADIGTADWELMFQVNLTSVFRIVQKAVPYLASSHGNIVTIGSTAAIHGIAYAAHYAASKAAIVALTKSLAVEYGPSGIRFNTVCPGKVKTAIGAGLKPLEDQNEALLVRPPKLAGRTDGGEPDDLAAAIAWLASDEARYISGSVLVVDGVGDAQVQLGRGLASAVLGPAEAGHDQFDGRRIHRMDGPLEPPRRTPAAVNELGIQLLQMIEHLPEQCFGHRGVPRAVGVGQGVRTGHDGSTETA